MAYLSRLWRDWRLVFRVGGDRVSGFSGWESGTESEWRNSMRWNLPGLYPLTAVSGWLFGASSNGARRNASRQGWQMPWVVTGRTAADSGPGSGPGSKTPHQAHTRIHTGEASEPATIAFPSKINESIGCL